MNINYYEPFFSKFDHFAQTFIFLTPKERDINCSHEVMLKNKLTHKYIYVKLIQ